MSKLLRTLTVSAVFAMSQAAMATDNYEKPQKKDNGTRVTGNNTLNGTVNGTVNGTIKGSISGSVESENTNLNKNNNTANGGNGVGIGQGGKGGTGTATVGNVAGGTVGNVTTGPSTSTATTGSSTATVGNVGATGGNVGNVGGGSVGPITNQTKNEFRSFVAANAPNVGAAVDKCLAVVGSSFSLGIMGSAGISIGGGSTDTKFVEQCSAVYAALQIFADPSADQGAKLFALNMVVAAHPTYGPTAKAATIQQIESFEGTEEPASLTCYWTKKCLTMKPATPAVPSTLVNITNQNDNAALADAQAAGGAGGTARVMAPVSASAPAAPAAPAAKKPATAKPAATPASAPAAKATAIAVQKLQTK